MIDYLSAMFCTYKRKEKCWKISTEKSLASHFNSPRLDPNPRPGTSPRSHSLRCRRLSPHRAASAFQSSVPSLSPPHRAASLPPLRRLRPRWRHRRADPPTPTSGAAAAGGSGRWRAAGGCTRHRPLELVAAACGSAALDLGSGRWWRWD